MGETTYVDFSEAAIKREALDEDIRELRDRHFPELRLRFRTDRRFATWDVLYDGKWKKAANYPQWGWKVMRDNLSGVLEQRGGGAKPDVREGALITVDQLLTWFLVRHLSTATLSSVRKANCKSVIKTWLRPRLSDVLIADLNKALLDRLLIHPMQAVLAPSTIRHAYSMLIAAIRGAKKLGLLAANPLADVRFAEFGLGKIKPKDSRLFPLHLDALVTQLVERFAVDPRGSMLALLMLCFGTRVGETRQLRWCDFHVESGLLIIPAGKTKTRTRLELALLPAVVHLLGRYRAAVGVDTSGYLFPGEGGGPLTAQSVTGIFAELSGGEWSSHDLRKLARTCWALLGVDYVVGELLLNHAMPGLTPVYIQTKLSGPMRDALELWQGPGNGKAGALELEARFALADSCLHKKTHGPNAA
ncbi:tyrosine-type recombinase/integrase [Pseudomonas sp. PDM29]|uniref:tyrosine-type recombinase/integrase n=1 Tax=Pseudomonas sp. PDM29 TaxID=2854771 RepID=UPI001C484ED3|nr:tyrosine-type recombinase/integrase [Pseudomonas sp. PDM29]MBV7523147.1 tyrosine-type recombinase/integrase [Pseudomonas sp. PDM29]